MIQKINISSMLPYSVEKMYFLVNDVNSYYKFIPNCIGSRILEINSNYNIASIDIFKYGVKNTLTTKNILVNNKSINMNIINNKTLNLVGYWKFNKLNNSSSIVQLNIEFELSSTLLEYIFNVFFEKNINSIVQAFNDRAKKLFSNCFY